MQNSNSPIPEDQSNPEILSSASFSVNGQNIESMNQLPPEVLEKIQKALTGGNMGSILNVVSMLAKNTRMNGIGMTNVPTADLQKITQMIKDNFTTGFSGGDQQTLKNIMQKSVNGTNAQEEAELKELLAEEMKDGTTTRIAMMQNAQHPNNRSTTPDFDKAQQKQNFQTFSSNHNPHVQNDGWRKLIWVAVAVIVGGYLYYRYGLNSQLPF